MYYAHTYVYIGSQCKMYFLLQDVVKKSYNTNNVIHLHFIYEEIEVQRRKEINLFWAILITVLRAQMSNTKMSDSRREMHPTMDANP